MDAKATGNDTDLAARSAVYVRWRTDLLLSGR